MLKYKLNKFIIIATDNLSFSDNLEFKVLIPNLKKKDK